MNDNNIITIIIMLWFYVLLLEPSIHHPDANIIIRMAKIYHPDIHEHEQYSEK